MMKVVFHQLSYRGIFRSRGSFFMCNNSLANFKIDPKALVKGCEITEAGVLELIERQADGCAYVKP